MRLKSIPLVLIAGLWVLPVLAQTTSTRSFAFEGYHFSFDPALLFAEGTHFALSQTENPGDSQAVNAPSGPRPPYLELILYTGRLTPSAMEAPAVISLYHSAVFAGRYRSEWEQLQIILAERPDLATFMEVHRNVTENALPFLPVAPAAQVIRTNVHYVDLDTMSGIGYLTTYRQDAYPFLADDFQYTFQGISADGGVYVSAVFNVTTDLFPAQLGADFDWDTFYDQVPAYIAEGADQLNAAKPEAFTPSLSTLDSIIRSFAVRRDATPLLVLRHEDSVGGATWNDNERRILSWSGTVVRVWDGTSGQELLTLDHAFDVFGATWNDDESRVLSWSGDWRNDVGSVRVWEASTGQELLVLNHDDIVRGASWDPDGRRILTWSYDNTVRVWDAVSGQQLLILHHQEDSVFGRVQNAMWNKDGSRILSLFAGAVWVWDAASGQELFALHPEGAQHGVTWSADEERILSWGWDQSLVVWDANSGAALLTLPSENGAEYGASDAMWSADEGHILAVRGSQVDVWDVKTGDLELNLAHEDAVNGAAWSADDGRILSWTGGDTSLSGSVHIWDAVSGQELLSFGHYSPAWGALWSANGHCILTRSAAGTVRLLDARTGRELFAVYHDSAVDGVQWSADESRVLSWSRDGTVHIWGLDDAVSPADGEACP